MSTTKTVLLLMCIVAALGIYWEAIEAYVSSLSHPGPLLFGFGLTAVIAFWRDLVSHGSPAHKMAVASTKAAALAAAAIVAHPLRNWYVAALRSDASRFALQWIGSEYAQAMSNHIVGYGGAFGFALTLAHLVLRRLDMRVFSWLHAERDGLEQSCPQCGRPYKADDRVM